MKCKNASNCNENLSKLIHHIDILTEINKKYWSATYLHKIDKSSDLIYTIWQDLKIAYTVWHINKPSLTAVHTQVCNTSFGPMIEKYKTVAKKTICLIRYSVLVQLWIQLQSQKIYLNGCSSQVIKYDIIKHNDNSFF